MIKAVIFDFDGLILNTESTEYEALLKLYAGYNVELPYDRFIAAVGTTSERLGFDSIGYLVEVAETSSSREELFGDFRRLHYDVLRDLPTMPGVRQWIDEARSMNLKLAVASASPHSWVDEHLMRLGLFDYFDVIRCQDDVAEPKPASDVYLSVLSALSIESSEAIVLEDSGNGLTAAKGAGLYTIVVPNDLTKHHDLSMADMRLGSLADVTLKEILTLLQKV